MSVGYWAAESRVSQFRLIKQNYIECVVRGPEREEKAKMKTNKQLNC